MQPSLEASVETVEVVDTFLNVDMETSEEIPVKTSVKTSVKLSGRAVSVVRYLAALCHMN